MRPQVWTEVEPEDLLCRLDSFSWSSALCVSMPLNVFDCPWLSLTVLVGYQRFLFQKVFVTEVSPRGHEHKPRTASETEGLFSWEGFIPMFDSFSDSFDFLFFLRSETVMCILQNLVSCFHTWKSFVLWWRTTGSGSTTDLHVAVWTLYDFDQKPLTLFIICHTHHLFESLFYSASTEKKWRRTLNNWLWTSDWSLNEI